MATHGFSGEVQRLDREGGPRENDGWLAYAWAQHAPRGSVALLHSFQREDELEEAKQEIYNSDCPDGVVYAPNGTHDMRVNSAWLLGLAHNAMPAVMTASIDDQTAVRGSAWRDAPFVEQNTDHNLSALAREVLGMTGSGHYQVSSNLMGGRQLLEPTLSASHATLADFQTPYGMPQAELKRKLDEHGVDTTDLDY